MNIMLAAILLVNFIYIGILPRIFFKKDGRYNLMWFVTASPIFLNAIVIAVVASGQFAITPLWPTSLAGDLAAVILSAFSVGMISYTMGTHRIPLALWHQTNDAPANIVTWGAYKYIRHPFYSSFIAVQIASVLAFPHAVTIVGLVAGIAILNQTAAREEARLSASSFGDEYKSYILKTGRFFPKLGS